MHLFQNYLERFLSKSAQKKVLKIFGTFKPEIKLEESKQTRKHWWNLTKIGNSKENSALRMGGKNLLFGIASSVLQNFLSQLQVFSVIAEATVEFTS